MVTTVTAFTADRSKAIEDSAVIGGVIVGDNLILVTHAGDEIDAGNVRGPQGNVGPMGSVTPTDLANAIAAATATGAITSSMIANGAITELKLADGSVTAVKLSVASVTSAALAVDSVMQEHIQANAVSTPEIADAAITAVKIATGAVSGTKIADNTITAAKIAALAIDASKIANLTVTAAKIADATITEAKLSSAVLSSGWIDCGLGPGWTVNSPIRRLRAKKVGNIGYLSGSLKCGGSGGTVVAAQLPASVIPTASMSGVCSGFSSPSASVSAAPANFGIVPITGEIVVFDAVVGNTYGWTCSYEMA